MKIDESVVSAKRGPLDTLVTEIDASYRHTKDSMLTTTDVEKIGKSLRRQEPVSRPTIQVKSMTSTTTKTKMAPTKQQNDTLPKATGWLSRAPSKSASLDVEARDSKRVPHATKGREVETEASANGDEPEPKEDMEENIDSGAETEEPVILDTDEEKRGSEEEILGKKRSRLRSSREIEESRPKLEACTKKTTAVAVSRKRRIDEVDDHEPANDDLRDESSDGPSEEDDRDAPLAPSAKRSPAKVEFETRARKDPKAERLEILREERRRQKALTAKMLKPFLDTGAQVRKRDSKGKSRITNGSDDEDEDEDDDGDDDDDFIVPDDEFISEEEDDSFDDEENETTRQSTRDGDCWGVDAGPSENEDDEEEEVSDEGCDPDDLLALEEGGDGEDFTDAEEEEEERNGSRRNSRPSRLVSPRAGPNSRPKSKPRPKVSKPVEVDLQRPTGNDFAKIVRGHINKNDEGLKAVYTAFFSVVAFRDFRDLEKGLQDSKDDESCRLFDLVTVVKKECKAILVRVEDKLMRHDERYERLFRVLRQSRGVTITRHATEQKARKEKRTIEHSIHGGAIDEADAILATFEIDEAVRKQGGMKEEHKLSKQNYEADELPLIESLMRVRHCRRIASAALVAWSRTQFKGRTHVRLSELRRELDNFAIASRHPMNVTRKKFYDAVRYLINNVLEY